MSKITQALPLVALIFLVRCSDEGSTTDAGGGTTSGGANTGGANSGGANSGGASGTDAAGSGGQSGNAGSGGSGGQSGASASAGSGGSTDLGGAGGDTGDGGDGANGGGGACDPEPDDGDCNTCLKSECCDVWPACAEDDECSACTSCLDDENDLGTCLIRQPPVCNNTGMATFDLLECGLGACVSECGFD